MGFKEKEFESASKVCSDNHLHKQAGNSIVVNVLEAILKKLIIEKEGINQWKNYSKRNYSCLRDIN